MEQLTSYAWPGNVRELRHVMVRAALFAQGARIGAEHLHLAPAEPDSRATQAGVLRAEVRELEKRRIVEALKRCGNNQVETAKELGIARGTLRSRMKELGLLPK
jgi:DNA-binding NtrC family response regulator